LFVFLSGFACTENEGTGTSGSGTIISNPKPPALNVFPDFSSHIPDTSLYSSSSSASNLKIFKRIYSLLVPDTMAVTANAENAPGIWELIFVNGGFAASQEEEYNAFNSLGSEIASSMSGEGITEVTSTAQSFRTSNDTTVGNRPYLWAGSIKLDDDFSSYINIYLADAEIGNEKYYAKYSFYPNADYDPVKGIFVYTVGNSLSSDDESRRLVSFAFDYTDSSKKLMIFRLRQYSLINEQFYSLNVHQQCNASTNICTGQYNDEFGENYIFTWNESTKEVCLAELDYSTGAVVIGDTAKFTGPSIPDESEVVESGCSIEQLPEWGSHVYTSNDLFTDSDISVVYGDGTSLTSWDTYVTPSVIDGWLNASSLSL